MKQILLFIGKNQWGSNEGFEFFISILAIIIIGIWALTSNGDMGTHEDTGKKVKSLNTSDGKRNRSKRAYYKRKLEEIIIVIDDKQMTAWDAFDNSKMNGKTMSFYSDKDWINYQKYTEKYNDTWL